MKYEWKSVSKIGCFLLLLLAGFTLLGAVYIISPLFQGLFQSKTYELNQNPVWVMFSITIFMGGLFLYAMAIVAAIFGMMLYLGIRFYKTMYTDEGYLTHTLPVKPGQLLMSKLLVGTVWMMLIGVAVLISVLVNLSVLFISIADIIDQLEQVWEALKVLPVEFNVYLKAVFGKQLMIYYTVLILSIVFGPFLNLCILYGAITIGQLARKHKILLSIFTYGGILVILSSIRSTAAYGYNFTAITSIGVADFDETIGSLMSSTTMVQFIITAVLGIAAYFLSKRIIKKNLNLD